MKYLGDLQILGIADRFKEPLSAPKERQRIDSDVSLETRSYAKSAWINREGERQTNELIDRGRQLFGMKQ